jgi:hypothetical protein
MYLHLKKNQRQAIMMDMNNYRRRLKSGGEDPFLNTKKYINENFTDNPYYQKIIFDGDRIDAIVNPDRDTDEKTILLRPTDKIDKGEYIAFEKETWLVMDFNKNEVYPTLNVKLCNQYLISDNEDIPVVAMSKRSDLDEGKYLILNTDEIIVYASYQKTNHISFEDRFYLSNREYEVIGIDDVTDVKDGKGIVKYTMKITGNTINSPNKPISEVFPSPNDEFETGTWGDW